MRPGYREESVGLLNRVFSRTYRVSRIKTRGRGLWWLVLFWLLFLCSSCCCCDDELTIFSTCMGCCSVGGGTAAVAVEELCLLVVRWPKRPRRSKFSSAWGLLLPACVRAKHERYVCGLSLGRIDFEPTADFYPPKRKADTCMMQRQQTAAQFVRSTCCCSHRAICIIRRGVHVRTYLTFAAVKHPR